MILNTWETSDRESGLCVILFWWITDPAYDVTWRDAFVAQECVRSRALRSILTVRKVSREEAERVVDEVFDSCFNDHAPFGRIPHSKKDAKFAYRDFENRDRYYANL